MVIKSDIAKHNKEKGDKHLFMVTNAFSNLQKDHDALQKTYASGHLLLMTNYDHLLKRHTESQENNARRRLSHLKEYETLQRSHRQNVKTSARHRQQLTTDNQLLQRNYTQLQQSHERLVAKLVALENKLYIKEEEEIKENEEEEEVVFPNSARERGRRRRFAPYDPKKKKNKVLEDDGCIGYIFLIGMPKPKIGYNYFLFPYGYRQVEPSPFYSVDDENSQSVYVCPWDTSEYHGKTIAFQVYATNRTPGGNKKPYMAQADLEILVAVGHVNPRRKILLKTPSIHCLPPPRGEGDEVRWFFTKKDRVYFIDNRLWKDSYFAEERGVICKYYEDAWASLLNYCYSHLNRELPPYIALCIMHEFRQKVCTEQLDKEKVENLMKGAAPLVRGYIDESKKRGVSNWEEVAFLSFVLLTRDGYSIVSISTTLTIIGGESFIWISIGFGDDFEEEILYRFEPNGGSLRGFRKWYSRG